MEFHLVNGVCVSDEFLLTKLWVVEVNNSNDTSNATEGEDWRVSFVGPCNGVKDFV